MWYWLQAANLFSAVVLCECFHVDCSCLVLRSFTSIISSNITGTAMLQILVRKGIGYDANRVEIIKKWEGIRQ